MTNTATCCKGAEDKFFHKFKMFFPYQDLSTHLLLCGEGQTPLLGSIARHFIETGEGFMVIGGEIDFSRLKACAIDSGRAGDLVIFNLKPLDMTGDKLFDAMAARKIVLVKVSHPDESIGEIIPIINSATGKRLTAEEPNKRFFFLIDDADSHIHRPFNPTLFSQARAMRCAFLLGVRNISRLAPEIAEALCVSTNNKVVFKQGLAGADLLSRHIKIPLMFSRLRRAIGARQTQDIPVRVLRGLDVGDAIIVRRGIYSVTIRGGA